MTLFEDYPGAHKDGRHRHECCESWTTFKDQMEQAWKVLHTFAHSRVPFTENYLAEQCGTAIELAAVMAREAANRGWIQAPEEYSTTRPGDGQMWIGSLSVRRRGI